MLLGPFLTSLQLTQWHYKWGLQVKRLWCQWGKTVVFYFSRPHSLQTTNPELNTNHLCVLLVPQSVPDHYSTALWGLGQCKRLTMVIVHLTQSIKQQICIIIKFPISLSRMPIIHVIVLYFLQPMGHLISLPNFCVGLWSTVRLIPGGTGVFTQAWLIHIWQENNILLWKCKAATRSRQCQFFLFGVCMCVFVCAIARDICGFGCAWESTVWDLFKPQQHKQVLTDLFSLIRSKRNSTSVLKVFFCVLSCGTRAHAHANAASTHTPARPKEEKKSQQ